MRSVRLSIPEPCGERWSGMRPAGENKMHCGSCNKVLVDFSKMSDTELALWFSQSREKVCGRFSEAQLERKISVPVAQPKRKNWLNAFWLLPLSLFAKPSAAQSTTPEVIKSKPPVSVNTGEKQPAVVQQQVETAPDKIISGIVMDDFSGSPLDSAEVTLAMLDGKKLGLVITDSTGKYSFVLPENVKLSEMVITIRKKEYEVEQYHADVAKLHEKTFLSPERMHVKMGIVIYNKD